MAAFYTRRDAVATSPDRSARGAVTLNHEIHEKHERARAPGFVFFVSFVVEPTGADAP